MTEARKIRCNQCAHYYITHDIHFPYGCRRLDFKSRQQPMRVVMESSGHDCLYFTAKPGSKDDRSR